MCLSRKPIPIRLFPMALAASALFYCGVFASAQTVSSFPLPNANANPSAIAAGPDGALWFTEIGPLDTHNNPVGPAKIGRISTAGAITEFAIPTANSDPTSIVAGSDGALWFTEKTANNIGRITTLGVVTEYAIPTASSSPLTIAAGPDGALWFTEQTGNKIGRITTAGAITEFAVPTASSQPYGITAGPDGALWFTEQSARKIGRITTGGSVTDAPLGTSVGAGSITTGPDGNLWTVSAYQINHISTSGVVTSFGSYIGMPSPNYTSIAAGPDGAMWMTVAQEAYTSVARISVSDNLLPIGFFSQSVVPSAIALGPDGAMWFTAVPITFTSGVSEIGRISTAMNTLTISEMGSGRVTSSPSGIDCGTTCSGSFFTNSAVTLTATTGSYNSIFAGWSGGGCAGTAPCTVTLTADTTVTATFTAQTNSTISLVAAVLPSSRSFQMGGAAANVFATIINAGGGNGVTCFPAVAGNVPLNLTYQTTDPRTNALTGTSNTPVNIPQGGSQTFVLAITPTATFAPTDFAFNFYCANANPAAWISGVDTLLLSSSIFPTPDVIASVATPTGDGIIDIPGTGGTNAFVVATDNVGASAAITASADTGNVTLPVAITTCQTDPATSVCLASPGSSVATTIDTGETPTFGIFVTANGAVPFSPAANRIFVRFKDASGATRGLTSVAVRTQ
jgi:virginiamycin B lyase